VDWVRWEVRPWRDERGAIGGIFIYSENIAARKRFEEELSKKTEELETALHARDIFLSVASHELRTPLTPLMLQLQSLRMQAERSNGDPLPTAKVIDKLQKSERQVTHLVRLVENLLDVSRLAEKRLALDLTTFELGALVQEVIDRLKPEFERTNTPVEAKLDPTVRGEWDRARVDQVVMNLLGNALKYGHGKLVEVEVSARDGDALLVVRDRGIGISAEDQKRIFGRFERAVSEKNYGGFGLGLWISIQLLEAMRGKIEVDSEVGAGATFRVVLPATSLSRG
jgi:signal transduction histidine kinase